ncbi:hypothetical protein TNCV_5026731 [Trichonephila clavipes]|uniref:Uncharacterized protein n=1 Tax=Trichonephila clavipes TaxID=2585209 RepID=A0A8X6RS93_TRICX|nr:hypothetical protein TNCV_5026731 [Trichonephila clavipes]
MREANDVVLDRSPYLWSSQRKSQGDPISGPLLCEKVLELNEKLGCWAYFKGQNEDDSLKWRAVASKEAGQAHAEVARWLQVTRNASLGYRINSKKVVLSPGRSVKAGKAPQPARNLAAVPGRRISKQTLYSRLADCPLRLAPSLECPFDCIQQKRQNIVEPKTPVVDIIRMGHVLFSDESRFTRISDSCTVLIWRKKMELAFIPSTQQK